MVKKNLALVGEGLTEKAYFDSLRISERYRFKIEPDLPGNTDIIRMAKSADKLVDEGNDYVYLLADMDKIESDAAVKKNYKKARSKSNKKIRWLHTYPCTEFWFLLHFMKQGEVRRYSNYDEVVKELRKYMPGYEKTGKYFKKINLYKYLTTKGNLEQAIKNAKMLEKLRKKEGGIDYSEIYKVIEMIQKLKAERNK